MMAATDSRTFSRDLRPGLPVRAVPDDQGPARGDPLLRRAPRRRRLPRRRALVPAADREAHLDDRRPTQPLKPVHGLFAIVGFLVCVELASGVLQGYYTPIYSDIADHLVDQGRRRQLVRGRAAHRLGARGPAAGPARRPGRPQEGAAALDRGHRPGLAGCWRSRPSFTTFLIGWAVQGAYVVWLPLEIAIIHRRTAGTGRQALLTRRAAAILVGALELAVIIGALTSGALVEATSMGFLLALPAIVVTVVLLRHLVRDRGRARRGHRRLRLGRAGADHRRPRPGDGRADRDPRAGPRLGAGLGAGPARPGRAGAVRALRGRRTPSRWSTSACSRRPGSGRCS